MNAFRPVLVASGAVLISAMAVTAGLAQAATVTLSGGSSGCTIGSLTGDSTGNLTIVCSGSGGTPLPPPSTSAPQCSRGDFTATVGSPISMTLSCNSSTTSATWVQALGPSPVAISSGTSVSANFPSAGTWAYNVTPRGANNSSGQTIEVWVTVGSASTTPPPATGSGDTALCTAYPGSYRGLLSYVLPAGAGTNITDFVTLTSNSGGYAPIATMRLMFDTATGSTRKGSIVANESSYLSLQGVNKWASISTRPCDFADTAAGGTARWVTHGTSISITYTVEDTEGYITPYAFMPSFIEGVRLRAGQAYYLNIVNGGPSWNTPSCPAGSNCGLAIDIGKP